MSIRPPFPSAIDSSMRAAFAACPRKFQLQYLEHWKLITPSIHLHAGGAFAFGIETVRRAAYERGADHETAVMIGVRETMKYYGLFDAGDSPKDLFGILQALVFYFDHFGTHTDYLKPTVTGGKPAIEFTFALPISPDLLHPETGDPILYTGRFDMLAEYHNGPQEGLWAVDEKTTSQMGKTWSNQWVLRSQLTGYSWAAREYGYPCAGAVIRGISIQKTDIKFGEYIAHRPQWMVDRWHAQLIRDTRRMLGMWHEGFFDYNLDNACSDYGGCPFLEVCSSAHPERWLNANFHRVKWDPLARVEVAV